MEEMGLDLASGIGIIFFILLILGVLLRDGGNRSMALRGLRRKGRTSWLTVLALAVGTAVIMSSLAVNDAMRGFVVQKAEANLSGIDIVVLSPDFFGSDIVNELEASDYCSDVCNGVEPAIIIPTVLQNTHNKRTVARASLFGLEQDIDKDIGMFKWSERGAVERTGDPLENDLLVINKKAKEELDAWKDQTISIKLDDPSVRKETIFTKSGVEDTELDINEIVNDEGLGRLQFSVQDVHPGAYTTIETIDKLLGMDDMVNAILISIKDTDPPKKAAKMIETTLDGLLGSNDLHLRIHSDPSGGSGLRITSEQVFFDPNETGTLEGSDVIRSDISTYFVDSISFTPDNGTIQELSYSTITGFDPMVDSKFGLFTENVSGRPINGDLVEGQIGITNWTADALGARVGDTLVVEYSLIDDYFNMIKHEREFTVAWIVDMAGKAKDRDLMPDFPGIEGAEQAIDWDPPFDIDWGSINQRDEDYWFMFKGTPKAYISLEEAEEMWGSDQGNLTMVKLDGLNRTNIEQRMDIVATSDTVGMIIVPIREQLIASASAMEIFLEMFLSFGSITIMAGMVFVASTFMMMIRERRQEIGTMLSLGIRRGRIFQYLLAEGLIYSLIGGLVGLFIGWLAATGLLIGLNTVWSSMVAGQTIVEQVLFPTYLGGGTVLLSLGSGLLLSFFTLVPLALRASSSSIMEMRGKADPERSERKWRILGWLFIIVGALVSLTGLYLLSGEGPSLFLIMKGLTLILWGVGLMIASRTTDRAGLKIRKHIMTLTVGVMAVIISLIGAWFAFLDPPFNSLGLFVSEGLFITISLFGMFLPIMWLVPKGSSGISSTLALSIIRKETQRTVSTIAVFALIIFSIVSLSVIVEVQNRALGTIAKEQGGGFDVLAEATSALELDVRTQASREKANVNLSVSADIIQLKTVGTSGAVCSNMNPQYPPRLIGADQNFIETNKFKLESNIWEKHGQAIWDKLGSKMDGRIPIFVDENTLIIYIGYDAYSGALGHVFVVDGENGPVELVVAGILSPSVIAGSFVLHEDFLEEVYPTATGYKLLFVSTDRPGKAIKDLEAGLSDYGLDARTVEDIVGENTQAEQGYMGLFQAYLGAGLIIGIMALSVMEAKAVVERRREIAMLRALGVAKVSVARMFYTEAIIMGILALAIGVTGGLFLALVSAPLWGTGSGIAVPYIFLTLFGLVLIGILILSSALPATRASRVSPAAILKDE